MVLESVLSGLSILIAGLIAIIRFSKIGRAYYPFIFCIWLAGINEVMSSVLVETGYHTITNNNIYSLLEAILFTAFFRNMGTFGKNRWIFFLLMLAFISLWVWENFFFGKITYVTSWFTITYSFCIALMAITTINKLVIPDVNKPVEADSRHILKNPVLLICIGSIAYFSFAVLVEIFWLYGLNTGRIFRIKVYEILVYINIVVNLIYALAVLWVRPK